MQVERGWSTRLDRKLWRWMARHWPAAPFTLSGETAAASITFDDVPDNAVTRGAPVLERHGVRGTFYVSPAMCGHRDVHWTTCSREQVAQLAANGHEVGCHTAVHVNVQSLPGAELAEECRRSRDLLRELTGRNPRNFAYPFGDLGLGPMRRLGSRFESCRTIYERLNVGTIDRAKVGAIGLFDASLTRERLRAIVREAADRKAWLVFYTHDVSERPTFMGTSPGLLGDTIDLLKEAGIPCLTMAAALRHHGFRPDAA